jgi:predicted transposase/invertase (TIGR01784 family)
METKNIKYLDPKNDLTFRKIFGQHPNIMRSFLNSVLPLEENQVITELTYEDPAMIPELPELKHSIVDVKCTDNRGRQFIVEMQMYWSSSFKSRMLFNAGKAYVKQIDRGHQYSEIRPVYGLSLVNDIFLEEAEYKDKYYHHYRLAHTNIPDEIIEGIELIFIELPKFRAKSFTEKKLRNLWLRFLTEIDENTTEVGEEFYNDQEIKEALEHLQVSAFSKEELAYYDKYWDRIRVEKAAVHDAIDKMNRKLEEAQKREEEAQKKLINSAKEMKKHGVPTDIISKSTGLSKNEIEKL